MVGCNPPSICVSPEYFRSFLRPLLSFILFIARSKLCKISNSSMNSSIQELLVSYTIRMALCFKAQVFFKLLVKSSSTPSLAKRAERSRIDFFDGKLSFKDVVRKYSQSRVNRIMEKAKDHCLHMAEGVLSADTGLDNCCVCLERKANYYVIHGTSAHKCVCAVCALDLALRPKPRCPKTRGEIWLLMESAYESYGCVCSGGCERLLVVEQRKNKGRTSYRPIAECRMCSLESFHAQYCRVLTLF